MDDIDVQQEKDQLPRKDSMNPFVKVVDEGDEKSGILPTIKVHGKTKQLCRKSLFVLTLDNCFRQAIISIVEWRWTDRFILFCIVVNSILLAIYQHRATPEEDHYWLNEFIDKTADNVLWAIFSTESLLKIIAWGFVCDKKTYLRDPWNILDFVVVISGLLERLNVGASIGFLRLFRLLRPLRSLNAVPQMKVLVNTVLSSVLKLGNVIVLGLFLFMVFGIVGISLMRGVFYHQCYETEKPELDTVNKCWSWNATGEERQCGGNYMCEEGGYCRGHEMDIDEALRPVFTGCTADNHMCGYPWCEGSAPEKVFKETEFVHFDNIGGACLLIFQSMTLEGWTDLMYMVEDAFSPWFAIIYFIMIVLLMNYFVLNIALAVVDEVQDQFAEEAEESEKETIEEEEEEDEEARLLAAPMDDEPWWDCGVVYICNAIAENQIFSNFILIVIGLNVIKMCLSFHSLGSQFESIAMQQAMEILEYVFLVIFLIEMAIMILALGPKGYVKNPTTAFDGFVVIISIIEIIMLKASDGKGAGGLSALRTFRLFRVMNKLASNWRNFKVLLKAIVLTGKALFYWLVLFLLVLYIFTLMWMSIFGTTFHFGDADSLYPALPEHKDKVWCDDEGWREKNFRQDCIPRAHFDTFVWGFITVFQVMTGENWNTIMYAGMRASTLWENTLIPPTILSAFLFIVMILFGQTLFLSLFLSMLISKFEAVKEEVEEQSLLNQKLRTSRSTSMGSVFGRKKSTKDAAVNDNEHNMLLPGAPDAPDERAPNNVQDRKEEAPEAADDSDDDNGEVEGNSKDEENLREVPSTKKWPEGYALCCLSESNCIRRTAKQVLTYEVELDETRIGLFDNIILVCILLSTLCMMIDTPLSDPNAPLTKLVRTLDTVFAIIFIFEMCIKLVAIGLFWAKDSYLRSGWNVLDGIVVTVSVIDFATDGGGPSFLRVLRILRTFRPLRVISRNEGLKLVVDTVFQAIGDLGVLVIVASLFTLIFALVFLMYLKGLLYYCEEPDGEALAFLPPHYVSLVDFTVPLCLGTHILNGSLKAGSFDGDTGKWTSGSCDATHPNEWRRLSSDTPICIAKCDPHLAEHPAAISHLCSKKYSTPEELPPVCSAYVIEQRGGLTPDEQRGQKYIEDMQRVLTIPCGGASPAGGFDAGVLSCKENFCPDAGETSESCKTRCSNHKLFCWDACARGGTACEVCRLECEAACMCQDFCTPLIYDAALCLEQGASWSPVLSQNFDNIFNAMLTLFEIMTTEGWVDVMYAASDAVGEYKQPVRDTNHGLYVIMFPLWILLSFMFLVNLAVGVIVENFDQLQDKSPMMTDAQSKWITSRKSLDGRKDIFDLYNINELGSFRRTIYDIISSKAFENTIMMAIVVNSLIMALTIFPSPTDWWLDFQQGANYFFAAVYTIEAIMKLIALQCSYWKDAWNRFDFVCVVATFVGIVMKMPPFNLNVSSATSVIRILRIARLFRLLRFLEELNRLFMCLLISIPKLFNVTTILLLFLVLFSILGMSLFGTSKFPDDGTLNVHGNFQTFWRSFVTLFRASTGEAWNEIMHDLAHDEAWYFDQGSWCSPQSLFKSTDEKVWETLDEKCLIEMPNACPGDWNPMAAFYWVFYTLIITIMILNLVVAVTLQGYQEGVKNEEDEKIDLCIQVWKDYDKNHKMSIPFADAVSYINEVMARLKEKSKNEDGEYTIDIPPLSGKTLKDVARRMSMKMARAVQLIVTDDDEVTYLTAAMVILRISMIKNLRQLDEVLKEIDSCDVHTRRRDTKVLRSLEESIPAGQNVSTAAAAMLIQHNFKRFRSQGSIVKRIETDPGSPDSAQGPPSGRENKEDSAEAGRGMPAPRAG